MLLARCELGRHLSRRLQQNRGQLCIKAHRRCASTEAAARRIAVGQGGSLSLRLGRRTAAQVEVTGAWIDHIELSCSGGPSPAVEVDERNQAVAITEAPGAESGGDQPLSIKLLVPEKFNLDLEMARGDVRFEGKVEGTVRAVITESGDISASKLRGTQLVLEARHGVVQVGKYLEGDISLAAAAVHARMIKGHSIKVDVRGEVVGVVPVDIDALFGNSVSVSCSSLPPEETERVAVKVARSHGSLAVMVQGGRVVLGGVNGSAHVLGAAGAVDVQFEALEKGQSSLLTTGTGAINVQVAPDVKARVEARAMGHAPIRASLTNFAPTAEGQRELAGYLMGPIVEPSRATVTRGGGGHGSGKIDLHGAQQQALKAFFSTGEGQGEDFPTIRVQSQEGPMTLRTLSWMDAIKKQFGMDHVDYNVPPHGPKHRFPPKK